MGGPATKHDLPTTEVVEETTAVTAEKASVVTTPAIEAHHTLTEAHAAEKEGIVAHLLQVAADVKASKTYQEMLNAFDQASSTAESMGTALFSTLEDLRNAAVDIIHSGPTSDEGAE